MANSRACLREGLEIDGKEGSREKLNLNKKETDIYKEQ